MCDGAICYSGSQLWTYWDSELTSNNLVFELFTYQANDQVRLQPPKFKFAIYSRSTTSSSVTLTNCELYKYYYTLKKKIIDCLSTHINNINKNSKYTDGFTFKTKRNNIYTTILNNELINTVCIRFMIGDKEQSILDTDKIFIPLVEFNSLFLTINKSFENYCVMSQNITMMDMFKKYVDTFENNLIDVNTKLSNLNINNISCNNKQNDIPKIDKDISDKISLDDSESESESNSDEVVVNNSNEQQNDFDSFLTKNRDGFELDLPAEQSEEAKMKTQKEIVHTNFFPEKLLKNDFSNLDIIIRNCCNTCLPLDSFVKTVYDTCCVDLYDGISPKNIYSMNYIATKNLKLTIGSFLQKKCQIPKSIVPIIVDDKICNQNKIDCVCFLILSYIYISKIVNDLKDINDANVNKSLIAYCLKTITSSFVFTHILDIGKDILVNCIDRLYLDLNDNGFFKKYIDDIFIHTNVKIDFNIEYLNEHIFKIYDTIQNVKDKLSINNFFNKKYMKLSYDDFDKIEKYDSDIIKTILLIEYGKDYNSTDKIPIEILKKFGLNDLKYDNSILINYIKSKYPNFKDIEQIKNINTSVKDIVDKIDINNYPLDILKALYFWNVDSLPKKLDYDMFSKMIENSSLSENEIMSMILNNNYKIDKDFYNSLRLINT